MDNSIIGAQSRTPETENLPFLIDRASSTLAAARTSGEVLEARDMARVAFDAAKLASRIAKAKHAHDEVVHAANRAMADALLIEARAKIRLADEYDSAQERGEAAGYGRPRKKSQRETKNVEGDNEVRPATAADIGLRRDEIHDARILRDAEISDPGVISRALDEQVQAGESPSKSQVKRIAHQAAGKPQNKKPSEVERLKARIAELEQLVQDVQDVNNDLTDQTLTLADLTADEKRQLMRFNQLREYIRTLEHRRDQLIAENTSLKRQVKAMRRRLGE